MVGTSVVIKGSDVQVLIDVLACRGYTVIGPKVIDGSLMSGEIHSASELPVGWKDEQDGGYFRLVSRDGQEYFGFSVGQNSPKFTLHSPVQLLFRAMRCDGGFDVECVTKEPSKFVFFGIRPCDLRAVELLDGVLMDGEHADSAYMALRDGAAFIVVNCGHPSAMCFCKSMNAGPRASGGYDLALTEVLEGDSHYFVVDVGTDNGAEIIADFTYKEASLEHVRAAESVIQRSSDDMAKSMESVDLRDLLYKNYDNPRWEEVAKRCLSCGNCTMVCPTCFCTDVEDCTDLSGVKAERWKKWHSCFTSDFSYIHGGSIRSSVTSRYRHWMIHKLATWFDQFGVSGCVGCGRCITWCPVGIDITEEVRAILKSDGNAVRIKS